MNDSGYCCYPLRGIAPSTPSWPWRVADERDQSLGLGRKMESLLLARGDANLPPRAAANLNQYIAGMLGRMMQRCTSALAEHILTQAPWHLTLLTLQSNTSLRLASNINLPTPEQGSEHDVVSCHQKDTSSPEHSTCHGDLHVPYFNPRHSVPSPSHLTWEKSTASPRPFFPRSCTAKYVAKLRPEAERT